MYNYEMTVSVLLPVLFWPNQFKQTDLPSVTAGPLLFYNEGRSILSNLNITSQNDSALRESVQAIVVVGYQAMKEQPVHWKVFLTLTSSHASRSHFWIDVHVPELWSHTNRACFPNKNQIRTSNTSAVLAPFLDPCYYSWNEGGGWERRGFF